MIILLQTKSFEAPRAPLGALSFERSSKFVTIKKWTRAGSERFRKQDYHLALGVRLPLGPFTRTATQCGFCVLVFAFIFCLHCYNVTLQLDKIN